MVLVTIRSRCQRPLDLYCASVLFHCVMGVTIVWTCACCRIRVICKHQKHFNYFAVLTSGWAASSVRTEEMICLHPPSLCPSERRKSLRAVEQRGSCRVFCTTSPFLIFFFWTTTGGESNLSAFHLPNAFLYSLTRFNSMAVRFGKNNLKKITSLSP